MNRIVLFAILAVFALPAFAQNGFGNDVDRKSYKLHPDVPWIRDVWVNDYVRTIEYDSSTSRLMRKVLKRTSGYVRGVPYVQSTGARLLIVDSSFFPDHYLNGDPYMRNMGTTIFLWLRDLKSYIEIYVDLNVYVIRYNRELLPPGTAYSGMNDPKIIGVDPMLDQKTLGDLLYENLESSPIAVSEKK